MRARTALCLAALALLLSVVAYMTIGARGNIGFILSFRGTKLVALITVAIAVALSTITFQTITANRILTPSIMGFDALYMTIQTGLVFVLSGFGYTSLNVFAKFGVETAVMMGAALLLFGALLRRGADLSRMILTGLIFGTMFGSITALLNRMIDPNEFSVIQSASFARFSDVPQELTWVTLAIVAGSAVILMRRAGRLDVLALGREAAINLGVDFDRESRRLLVVVALLVSASTALVGPVVFFGLLVSALAHQLLGTWRHALLLPFSALLSATILIASQTLFERVLDLQSTVSVVIEALGGLVFIALILRRSRT